MILAIIARLVYGTPLAIDPAYRQALLGERQERAKHGSVRQYQQARRDRLHEALRAGRP